MSAQEQAAAWARAAGWPDDRIKPVVATVIAESGGNPGVANGLMQMGPEDFKRYKCQGDIGDPVAQLRCAKAVYDQGKWTKYFGTWADPQRGPAQNRIVESMASAEERAAFLAGQGKGDGGGGGGGGILDAIPGYSAVSGGVHALEMIGKAFAWLASPHNIWRIVEVGVGVLVLFLALGSLQPRAAGAVRSAAAKGAASLAAV